MKGDYKNPFEEQKRRLQKVRETAKMWQTCPYDLIKSPLSLPSTIPDPYAHYRGEIKVQEKEGEVEEELLNSYSEDGIQFDPKKRKFIMSPAPDCEGFNGDKGAEKYALGRRFFVTEKQYFGLASPQAEKGDRIAFVMGYAVPFILRREGENYRIIGETHVQGLMNGEILEECRRGQAKLEVIDIV